MSGPPITTLFLDIGGLLLTNGWDRAARQKAAEKSELDRDDMEERHHLTYDTYEAGKLSLDEYLQRLFFTNRVHLPRKLLKNFCSPAHNRSLK